MLSSNWCEAVRRKIESTPWEQAIDDVRPFIASQDELVLLTKENLLNLLKIKSCHIWLCIASQGVHSS